MELPAEALLYVGDPMCSWCYGFNPVLTKVEEVYGDRLPVHAIMGGLRPGEHAQQMDEKLKKFLIHHWKEVARATGQPFQYEALDREGFVYDTEPACRSVVAFRNFLPDRVFAYFGDLQSAFYRDGMDPCDETTFAEIAKPYGLTDEFLEFFRSEEARYQTALDFQLARAVGVSGFPALVHLKDKRAMLISYGYTPFEKIQDVMDNLVLAPPAAGSQGDVCSTDGCD